MLLMFVLSESNRANIEDLNLIIKKNFKSRLLKKPRKQWATDITTIDALCGITNVPGVNRTSFTNRVSVTDNTIGDIGHKTTSN